MSKEPLYKSPKNCDNCLRVYKNWSFFKVRGKNQCLEHTNAARSEDKSLRLEIFAPILIEMLENREKLQTAFSLNTSNLLLILLNPTSQSFIRMDKLSPELNLATIFSVTERSRIQGKGIDLADSLRRVEYLGEELAAWKGLFHLLTHTVECMEWSHFEFRYSIPDATLSSAQGELVKARESVLEAIKKQAHGAFELVEEIIRTPDEIFELTDIV